MTSTPEEPSEAQQPSWPSSLRPWIPALPVVLGVVVALFTPLDMVWGVAGGIVLAVVLSARPPRN